METCPYCGEKTGVLIEGSCKACHEAFIDGSAFDYDEADLELVTLEN